MSETTMTQVISRHDIIPLFEWLDRVEQFQIFSDISGMRKRLEDVVERECRTQEIALNALGNLVEEWRALLFSLDLEDASLTEVVVKILRDSPVGKNLGASFEEELFTPVSSAERGHDYTADFMFPLRDSTPKVASATSSTTSTSQCFVRPEAGQLERECDFTEGELRGLEIYATSCVDPEVLQCKIDHRRAYRESLLALQRERGVISASRSKGPKITAATCDIRMPPLCLDVEKENVCPPSVALGEGGGIPPPTYPFAPQSTESKKEKQPYGKDEQAPPHKASRLQESAAASSDSYQWRDRTDELEIEIVSTQSEIHHLSQFVETCLDKAPYELRILHRSYYLDALLAIQRERSKRSVLQP